MKKTRALKVSQITEMALYFREKYNIKSNEHFPIFEVIEDFYEKGLVDFLIIEDDNPKVAKDVFGLYDYDTNTIYVKESVVKEYYNNIYRSNFTLAHEFFHFVQNKILGFTFEEVDSCMMYEKCEWQANEFAGQLLITSDYLNLDEQSLCEMFHVSIECALTRKAKKKNRMEKYNTTINKDRDYLDDVIEALVDSYGDLSLVAKEIRNKDFLSDNDTMIISSYIIGLIYPKEDSIINVIDVIYGYLNIGENINKYYAFAIGVMMLADGLNSSEVESYILNKYLYQIDTEAIEMIKIETSTQSTKRLENVVKSKCYLIKDRATRAMKEDDTNVMEYANNKMYENANYQRILDSFSKPNTPSFIYLSALINKYKNALDIEGLRNTFKQLKQY